MKSTYFLSVIVLLVEVQAALAQQTLPPATLIPGSADHSAQQSPPPITFIPGIANQVFGTGTPPALKGVLNCDLLINQTWPFPNSQVSGICLDATISCMRYSLMVKNLKKAAGDRRAILNEEIPRALKDANMKLMGCVEAIEGTITGTVDLPTAAGY